MSHANDPLSYHVTRLGETIKEDKPQFCKLVVERSEVTNMIFNLAFSTSAWLALMGCAVANGGHLGGLRNKERKHSHSKFVSFSCD